MQKWLPLTDGKFEMDTVCVTYKMTLLLLIILQQYIAIKKQHPM